jgi:methylmalonyl-CoA mutase N-terminal domain/subunit
MVLTKQFFTAIAGHCAKLVIDVGDPAAQVGLGKNRGGIHRPAVLLIHESGSLSLAVEPVQGSNTDAGNIVQELLAALRERALMAFSHRSII